MKKWFWIVCFPCFLLAVEPPMGFRQEPSPQISPEIRDQWMDGPKALAKEAVRNQKISAQHQFPLGTALIVIVALVLVWVGVRQWKAIISWVKRAMHKPLSSREKAIKRLKEIDAMPDLKDRYRLLSQMMRENIRDCYHIPALASTNEEVLEGLGESRKLYQRVLKEIETIEFQNLPPSDKHFQDLKKRVSQLLK